MSEPIPPQPWAERRELVTRAAVNGSGSNAIRGLGKAGALKSGLFQRMSRVEACRTEASNCAAVVACLMGLCGK